MEIDVAVPAPLPQTFTYSSDRAIAPGIRVMVPFGPRKLVGVVLGEAKPVEQTSLLGRKVAIKAIVKVLDESPVYSAVTLEIAKWLSRYYLYPLGEVLKAMLPAAVTKTVAHHIVLTDLGAEDEFLKELFGKKISLGQKSFEAKLIKLQSQRPLGVLLKEKLVAMSQVSKISVRKSSSEKSASSSAEVQEKPQLTPLQETVFNSIRDKMIAGQVEKPFLIRGVTGSGKTEVYLNLIEQVLADGAQALVLVPEISLTPQMTRVFEARFPERVAVVHSAMSNGERWRELERIRSGAATILIGPRSAVFGPFADLKLIIVDEEHDHSYKQTTGLSYHGRDIAVLRGHLEKACVVLGSATPSLESFYNAKIGKYELLELRERVHGRPMPQVSIVASKAAFKQGIKMQKGSDGDTQISMADEVLAALKQNLADGKQSMVLVNRRGYAYYLFSLKNRKAVGCPRCSISLTLHKKSTVMHCHYCDYQTTTAAIMLEKPDDQFVAVGYGSEKVEDYLTQMMPTAKVVRLDSDTTAQKDHLPRVLNDFRNGEIDILVGTQILAKGHDFPNVTLIALLEVDQLLDFPDFRAGEKTFQLIVQAAGRAGRAEHPGQVLIQTSAPNHPIIQQALSQDYENFAASEVEFRKKFFYPPFTRMVLVEINSLDLRKLIEVAGRMEQWFESMAQVDPNLAKLVRVLGPAAPPIEMIRHRYRRTILFSALKPEPMRKLVQQFMEVFKNPGADIRMKVDVDPQSLI
jgi:primosomal protein N' (replication factor Y)